MASVELGDVQRAVEVLRRGGVVAFPTETVYGLAADALNEVAVRRVFDMKGRPASNPMSVLVSGTAGARRVSREWPERAERYAQEFWPGPLTIVVPRNLELPGIVTAGGDTVGVRCPDHPLALALVESFGGPLVGPSANPSGLAPPTHAGQVRGYFPDADLVILDGGHCREGIASTVLRVSEDGDEIVRAGGVTAEQLGLAG